MTVQTVSPTAPENPVRGVTENRSDGESLPQNAPHRSDHSDPGAPVVSCVSAHGGAGATTLAEMLGVADVGRRWPVTAGGESGHVLLVARTHAAGLQAASKVLDAVQNHQRPDVRIVALVLVADAPGRLPRQLAQRVRVLKSAVKTFEIPWIPSLRTGGQPEQLPKEVRKIGEFISGEDR